ncbi:hypothetical protein LNA02_16570 [Levilactobacillus namurensis]|nr:hypothetical protein LNA02_16570 [Levilactobacillus namurensis]
MVTECFDHLGFGPGQPAGLGPNQSANAETTGPPVNPALGPAAPVQSHPVPEKAFQDPA